MGFALSSLTAGKLQTIDIHGTPEGKGRGVV